MANLFLRLFHVGCQLLVISLSVGAKGRRSQVEATRRSAAGALALRSRLEQTPPRAGGALFAG